MGRFIAQLNPYGRQYEKEDLSIADCRNESWNACIIKRTIGDIVLNEQACLPERRISYVFPDLS